MLCCGFSLHSSDEQHFFICLLGMCRPCEKGLFSSFARCELDYFNLGLCCWVPCVFWIPIPCQMDSLQSVLPFCKLFTVVMASLAVPHISNLVLVFET